MIRSILVIVITIAALYPLTNGTRQVAKPTTTTSDATSDALLPSGSESFTSYAHTGGAEHIDLWELRDKNPRLFYAYVYSLSFSPHVALGTVRCLRGDYLDQIVFGNDEVAIKSPWSILGFLFNPGLIACRYFTVFLDTNLPTALLLLLKYSSADIILWAELCGLLLPSYRSTAARALLVRNFLAIVAFVGYYLLYTVISTSFSSLNNSIHHVLFVAVLTFTALLNVYTLRRRIPAFYHAFEYLVSLQPKPVSKRGKKSGNSHLNRVVIDPAKAQALAGELRRSMNDVISGIPWSDLYTVERVLGEGYFGAVRKGFVKATGETVAIKSMKFVQESTGTKAKAIQLALSCIAGDAEGIVERTMNLLETAEHQTYMRFEHELRALNAVRVLQCPHHLRLYSAHVEGDMALSGKSERTEKTFTIVTGFVGKTFDDEEVQMNTTMENKLQLVLGLFKGLAELHAYGLTHRDIKMDNVAVSGNNVSEPVILDFGLTYLPVGRDPYVAIGCLPFMPPEAIRAKMENDSLALGLGGFMRSPADCWSAALAAAELLTMGQCRPVYDFLHANNRLQGDRGPDWSFIANWSVNDVELFLVKPMSDHVDHNGQKVPADVIAVLKAMLHPNPQERFTMAQAAYGDSSPWQSLANIASVQSGRSTSIIKSKVPNVISLMTTGYNFKYAMEYLPGRLSKLPYAPAFPANPDGQIGYNDALATALSTNPGLTRQVSSMRHDYGELGAGRLGRAASVTDKGPLSDLGPIRITSTRLTVLRDCINAVTAITCTVSSPRRDMLKHAHVDADFISKLREAFVAQIVNNNDGVDPNVSLSKELNAEQLVSVLAAVEKETSVPMVDGALLFEFLDENESGGVDFRELLAGLTFILAPYSNRITQVKLLFASYDVDGNGVLSIEEFKDMIAALGVSRVTSELHAGRLAETQDEGDQGEEDIAEYLFRFFDEDSSGGITEEELLKGFALEPELLKTLFDTSSAQAVDSMEAQKAKKDQ